LLTRRQTLRAAALGGGALALAACGATVPPAVGGTATPGVAAAATAPRAATATRPPGTPATRAATTVPSPAAAASPAAPPPDATLAQLLARVPARAIEPAAPGAIWFADLLGQRRRYGFAAIDTVDRLVALPREEFLRFNAALAGLPLAGLFGGAVNADGLQWRAPLGFDGLQFAQALYVGVRPEFATWSHAQGSLDPALIAGRLRAIGYAPRPYRDAEILVRNRDQIAAVGAARGASDFVFAAAEALPGAGTLTAARFAGGIDATLDALAGAAPTLADDPDYRAAVAALGPTVGAALVPGELLYHPRAQGIVVAPFATPSPYATALPAYRLASLGFADDGARRALALALVYADPAAAAAAGPILRDRLAAHRLDPRLARDGRTALLDYFALGAAAVVPLEGGAALVQPLPLTGDWPGLWLSLLQSDQLGFLRER